MQWREEDGCIIDERWPTNHSTWFGDDFKYMAKIALDDHFEICDVGL